MIVGTNDNFEKEVLKSKQLVLVDFWAPWCGPCRMVAPVVEELSNDYDGRVKFVKLNTDENPGVVSASPATKLITIAATAKTAVNSRKKVLRRRRVIASPRPLTAVPMLPIAICTAFAFFRAKSGRNRPGQSRPGAFAAHASPPAADAARPYSRTCLSRPSASSRPHPRPPRGSRRRR